MAFFLIVNFKPNNFFYSAKSHQPDTHRSKHFTANKNPDLFRITFKIFQTYGKIILVDDPPKIDCRQTANTVALVFHTAALHGQ